MSQPMMPFVRQAAVRVGTLAIVIYYSGLGRHCRVCSSTTNESVVVVQSTKLASERGGDAPSIVVVKPA